MSVDTYAELDLTKKVRFQIREEDTNADACDKEDNVTIYDNYWAAGSTLPKLQQTTEDQQQINAPSGKRDLIRPAAVFLVLLCLLLVAVVTFIVMLWIHDRRINSYLTGEKEQLQTNYSEIKSLNANLTQKTNKLQEDISVITKERDELQIQLETSSCPDKWIKFGTSCYLMSTSSKNWSLSKQFCEKQGAQLVIVSSKDEQMFLNSFRKSIWIGLTDQEKENVWKWSDGTNANTMYWGFNQPDNKGPNDNEDCVQISKTYWNLNSWNDYPCDYNLYSICEKILEIKS